MADCNRNTIVVNSSNFVPIVTGIFVDVVHAVDTVEVVSPRAGVRDDMPFNPRTIADGSNGGTGAGSGEVGNLARVSDVEVIVLMKEREI